MTARKTTDEFKKELENIQGSRFTLVGEYSGLRNPVTVKDNKTNETLTMSPRTLLRGKGKLRKNQKYTQDDIQEYIDKQYPNKGYELRSEYKGNRVKMNIYCPKHDIIFMIDLRQMKAGKLCPMCKQLL